MSGRIVIDQKNASATILEGSAHMAITLNPVHKVDL